MGPDEHKAIEEPKGFEYTDGSILIALEHGYRRYTPKPLSKRERAKIKRKNKSQAAFSKRMDSAANEFAGLLSSTGD